MQRVDLGRGVPSLQNCHLLNMIVGTLSWSHEVPHIGLHLHRVRSRAINRLSRHSFIETIAYHKPISGGPTVLPTLELRSFTEAYMGSGWKRVAAPHR